MPRFRFTTVPTGARKGPWRASAHEAREDALAENFAQKDDAAPGGIQLDLMVEIEEQPTVLTEWEIWACANETLRQHGLDAPIFAAMRADELLEQGDREGAITWQAIVHRINELVREPGGTSH